MSKLFFIDCFALIKVWATGFFGFHINGLIHILPLVAIFALLLGIINNKSIMR
ncbi:MAG: DUF5670 family protein [Bacteroidia bacterium]|jgi:hypothetical protein|nr:DUF5670 family protein [Bacteroidia bacterium]